MGTPDYFSFPCPACGERCTEQTKPGMCDSFTIEEHPDEAERFSGVGTCWKCGKWYELSPGATVISITEPEGGEDWQRLPSDVKQMIRESANEAPTDQKTKLIKAADHLAEISLEYHRTQLKGDTHLSCSTQNPCELWKALQAYRELK